MGGTTKARTQEAAQTSTPETSSMWDLIDYGSNAERLLNAKSAYEDAKSWLFQDSASSPEIAKVDTSQAKTSIKDKQDETLKDVAKGATSMPALETTETVEDYSSKTRFDLEGLSKEELVKHGTSETSLGEVESSTSTRMSLGPGGASLGGGRLHELKDSKGSFGTAGSLDTDGVIQGGVDFDIGGFEGGGAAMVDVGPNGLEGAGASAKFMGVEAGVSARLGKTVLDGKTVSWSAAMAVEGSGDVGSIGASVGLDGQQQQSITFPTEAAAAEFAEQQGALDIRAMSAEEIAALGPDVRLKYSKELSGKASGKMGASVNIGGKASESVEIESTGEALLLTVAPEEEASAGFGVGNGILEVVGKMYGFDESASEYRVDLKDPAQVAAYDRYRESGDVADLELVKREDRSGWGTEMIGSLGIGSWSSSGEQATGTIQDESGTRPYYEGISGESEEHWNGWRSMADAAEAVERYTFVPTLGAPIVETLGEAARHREEENFRQYGGRSGEERHAMRYLPTEEGGLIEQTQTVNYGDRADMAAFLKDQTDTHYDANAVSEYDQAGFGGLDYLRAPTSPLRAHNDRAYTLESIINAEGTAAIRNDLSDEASQWTMELDGNQSIGWIQKEFESAGKTTDAFGHAVMDAAYYGGDDAMEGFRHHAGEQNVEQFLSIEGDSNWLSRAGNKQLDDDFTLSEFDPEMRAELLQSERARLAELESGSNPEVPPSIRQAEVQRIRTRIKKYGSPNQDEID